MLSIRAEVDSVFSYLMGGGVENIKNLLFFLSDTYLGTSYGPEAPAPAPWEGIYSPEEDGLLDPDAFIGRHFIPGRPAVGLLFYRAHWMSGNLQAVDALIERLDGLGANVLPVFSYSLKAQSRWDRRAQPRAYPIFVPPRRVIPGRLRHQYHGHVHGRLE